MRRRTINPAMNLNPENKSWWRSLALAAVLIGSTLPTKAAAPEPPTDFPIWIESDKLQRVTVVIEDAGGQRVRNLGGCTDFAPLLKQSSVGLPTAPYGKFDPALAETIQKTVWQSVASHPDAGVAERTASQRLK